jgi:hypothetical protein
MLFSIKLGLWRLFSSQLQEEIICLQLFIWSETILNVLHFSYKMTLTLYKTLKRLLYEWYR